MNNQNNTLVNEALNYLKLGFSIIPVGRDKKSLIKWQEFQTRKPTEDEVTKWFQDFSDVGIAVVTGKISGIIVVDVEADGKVENLMLPPTVMSRTGGDGWHYFYKHPGHEIKNAVRVAHSVDIRGDGGYAILPPSPHISGKQYEWIISPGMSDFSELPEMTQHMLSIGITKYQKPSKTKSDWPELLEETNPEGQRNDKAAKVAGKLLHDIKPDLWETAGWPAFMAWNKSQNQPPLDEAELKSVWESITSAESSRLKNKPDSKKVFQPIRISELLKKVFSEPEWTIESLIPAAGITAVSGAPASYKTWIMLEMAIKITSGELLFNKFSSANGGVLIIDEENGERLFWDRFKKLNIPADANIHLLSLEQFKVEKSAVSVIKKFCLEHNIKLVILDSLVRIHSGNENDAMDMSEVTNQLKQLTKDGITVIFTHHNRKSGVFSSNLSQEMRGSSDILAAVDSHLAVTSKDNIVTITQTKSRHSAKLKPFQIEIAINENGAQFQFLGELDESKSKVDIAKDAVIKILEDRRILNKTEIIELLGQVGVKCGRSTTKQALDELEEDQILFTQKGKGNMTYCSLQPFVVAEESEVPVINGNELAVY